MDYTEEKTTHRRIREEVTDGEVVDRIYKCSSADINTVLQDWDKIKNNLRDIGIQVFENYFNEFPEYRVLFPALADIRESELKFNHDFIIHSLAIMNGISSVMMNLSAKYEEDNEILPWIAYTHRERGVTQDMMDNLKNSLVHVICKYLHSSRKGVQSWESVLSYIFKDSLCNMNSNHENEIAEIPVPTVN